ncbi:MAG: DUF1674 domain-containing protein [Micavibrio sp.]|nr:DUF1674 domain-containing protein [Micavibrio sp.]
MNTKKPSQEKFKAPIASQENSNEKHLNNGEGEHGGFKSAGLKEPTRYGDWEVKGRCSDF